MTVACYLEPSKPKSDKWMRAFCDGCRGHIVLGGKRSEDATDHVVMGNWPVARDLIADFKADGIPFWYLDSSYLKPPGPRYLRVERGRFWPDLTDRGYTLDRALSMGVGMRPWRRTGSYVLVAQHGPGFGGPWSIDIVAWNDTIADRVREHTDRPIVVRLKPKNIIMRRQMPSLAEHLADAWCVVTHSSTLAVDAVLAGVPVFCEPTCAAAPVGRTDLEIESPVYPDREEWLAALAWRQWSKIEMESGAAWAHIRAER